jgi:hypothetical protein
MDFLNNSVYGVPIFLLLALWWMTTQFKGNNKSSNGQSSNSNSKSLNCPNCGDFKVKAGTTNICFSCGSGLI